MSPRAERRLLVMRRQVAPADEPLYRDLWAQLAGAVGASGSHAWRFRSPAQAGERLEFLEFEAAHDPRTIPEAERVLARLDETIGRARLEEWLEDR